MGSQIFQKRPRAEQRYNNTTSIFSKMTHFRAYFPHSTVSDQCYSSWELLFYSSSSLVHKQSFLFLFTSVLIHLKNILVLTVPKFQFLIHLKII